MSTQPPANPYDEVPYPSFAYPQTHPDRLATLATWFGMQPAPVDHCRVLELGCGSGGNLLPMAEALPGSMFAGIDLSARHIKAAEAAAAELGISNIHFGQINILDVPASFGPFDYIIAHGVYSWVPPAVQDKLLAICRSGLAPQGVAYVSYNTYPGWHGRQAIRDMMRFHTRSLADPKERVDKARAFLDVVLASDPRPAYAQLLKEEQEQLRGRPDPFVLYDQLADVNAPVYFHEFIERAARHGLQYLAEAEISTMMAQRLGPEVAATVARFGGDLLGREQYLDFITNRPFRQTLLCHDKVALEREWKPDRVQAFRIRSAARCTSAQPDLRPGRPEEFKVPGGNTLGTDNALAKAALLHLETVWPRSVTYAALLTTARARLAAGELVIRDPAALARETGELAEALVKAFTADIVAFHLHEPALVVEPNEQPTVSAWARFQARDSDQVTNRRHEAVPIDEVTRQLVGLMDGSRNRPALLDAFLNRMTERAMILQQNGEPVTDRRRLHDVAALALEMKLHQLGRSALLVP
jgi:methyltransferase-like protein/SAM-dependent methyltransferase